MPDNDTKTEERPETGTAQDTGPVLAIGYYIGGLLGIFGVILLVWGAFGSPDNSRSLGHPFVLWWGAVLIVVAAGITAAAHFGRQRPTARSDSRDHTDASS